MATGPKWRDRTGYGTEMLGSKCHGPCCKVLNFMNRLFIYQSGSPLMRRIKIVQACHQTNLTEVLDKKKYTLCFLQHNLYFKCEIRTNNYMFLPPYSSHYTYLLKSSEIVTDWNGNGTEMSWTVENSL